MGLINRSLDGLEGLGSDQHAFLRTINVHNRSSISLVSDHCLTLVSDHHTNMTLLSPRF